MGTFITVLAASILSMGGTAATAPDSGAGTSANVVVPLHWLCC